MKRMFVFFLSVLVLVSGSYGQDTLDQILPVRGLSIAAPKKESVDRFVKFIEEELVPNRINTLLLRVDFNFEYKSHPELQSENPLSKGDVKKISKACKEGNIRVIPQINLLGHQSWFTRVGKLLEVYPQFNETPYVPLDKELKWPNEWGLYCLSYCPLHPEVHAIVFDLVDEIVEAFDTDAFHAGMDEVFYLADKKCPRCSGRDPAELFAGEVTKIRNHLHDKGRELWIWGDRLIDGKTTGIGEWEASYNNTYRAIDLIPKDVFICDWHYERADATAAYFGIKGFRVVSCPYRNARVGLDELGLMLAYRKGATEELKANYQGMMQTVWTSAENFMDFYYGVKPSEDRRGNQAEAFKELMKAMNALPGGK